MPGIPREVTEHALHLIPGSKPAKQLLRRFDDERHRAIGEVVATKEGGIAGKDLDD